MVQTKTLTQPWQGENRLGHLLMDLRSKLYDSGENTDSTVVLFHGRTELGVYGTIPLKVFNFFSQRMDELHQVQVLDV